MKKFIKRVIQVFFLVVALIIGWFVAYENSRVFATDIAFLECTTERAGFENEERLDILDRYIDHWGLINQARLQRDWIKGQVLLSWIDTDLTSENGLAPTAILKEEALSYSGYNYTEKAFRSIDRETLTYRKELREHSDSEPGYWVERSCKIITRETFERLQTQAADGTQARQKI